MRIEYKGLRSGNSRVAIISYAENEENKAYEIARKFTIATSYKVDTLVYGMLLIEVDDMNDFNNVKEWYKEFKTTTDNTTKTESDTTETNNDTTTDTTDTNDTESDTTDTNNDTDNTNETTKTESNTTDTIELIQNIINDINIGLKTDYFEKVRKGVKRLCHCIGENHKCIIGFTNVKHTFDVTITNVENGYYMIEKGNNFWIRKPFEFAELLFYKCHNHDIILKYYGVFKRE